MKTHLRLFTVVLLTSAGCSSSSEVRHDGGSVTDAALPDSGQDIPLQDGAEYPDSSGHPCVLTQPLTIDAVRVADSSLAIDSNGKLHIAYIDYITREIKYTSNASGLWVNEVLDEDKRAHTGASVAIDSNDKVHAIYVKAGSDAFDYYSTMYVTNASGSWATETADSIAHLHASNIVIDSNDKIHYSDWADSGNALFYTTNASGAWDTIRANEYGEGGYYSSIAMDTNNKLHISYYNSVDNALRYATNASGSWISQVVDDEGQTGLYTSMAIGSNNKVHISYYNLSDGALKHATNASGSWVSQVVDDEGQTGLYPSTAIDSNDKLHISYYDESLGELKYATNNSGAWVVSVIDSQGGSEAFHAMSSSIAIDSNDNIHISYPFLDVNVAGSYGLKYVALLQCP